MFFQKFSEKNIFRKKYLERTGEVSYIENKFSILSEHFNIKG